MKEGKTEILRPGTVCSKIKSLKFPMKPGLLFSGFEDSTILVFACFYFSHDNAIIFHTISFSIFVVQNM